jgi:predicted transcriptional regulator
LPALSATSFATSFRALTRRLLAGKARITLHDMKNAVLTIRLDPDLQRQLARLARRTGRSRSDLAREALRRQLALTHFDDLRRRIMPFAEARGYLTDDDVFRDVS